MQSLLQNCLKDQCIFVYCQIASISQQTPKILASEWQAKGMQ